MGYLITPCLALSFPMLGALAPQDEPRGNLQCVVVPADQAVMAIASQPDSPLIFEEAKFLKCFGGWWFNSYRIRNRGTKPIKGFIVAGWSTAGSCFMYGWKM